MKSLKKENDIRPLNIYKKYISLVNNDLKNNNYFKINLTRCPICSNQKYKHFLHKKKFKYVRCKLCSSIFTINRPDVNTLKIYYNKSKSNSFWYNIFWPTVVDSRVDLIFKKRASFLFKNKKSFNLNFKKYYDIGSGNNEFLKIIQKKINKKVYGIEPSKETIFKSKNIKIINSTFESAKLQKGSVTLFTAFELIEHVFSPYNFLKKIYQSLTFNGTLIMTFADPNGFELSTLKGKSTQFLPPLHLNFLSVSGCSILLKKIGFKDIQIISMGRLDTDIVKKSTNNKDNFIYKFSNYKYSQDIINRYNISSHKWLIAKK